MRLNPSTGMILGTPNAAGTYTFTVTATSGTATDSRTFTITVQPAAAPTPTPTPTPTVTIKITKTSLASGTVGASYNDLLTADTSGVTWSVNSGTFPAGLSLNASTGSITGTPTSAGSYTFTVKATSGTSSATQQLSITIQAASSPAPAPTPSAPDNPSDSGAVITTTSLADGTVGTYYSQSVTVSADSSFPTTMWSWDISAGSLPPGLRLSGGLAPRLSGFRTVGLTGTPTTAGTYTFTVTATRGDSKASKQFTVKIAQASSTPTPAPAPSSQDTPAAPATPTPSITITKTSLASGTAGASYTDMLTANTSGVTWSVSSWTLPAGLTLNASTGTITGTPTTTGTYTFTVKATSGAASATKQYTITVSAPQQQTPTQSLQITGSFPNGTAGTIYDDYVAVSGGTAPYTYTTTGNLPSGLELYSAEQGDSFTLILYGSRMLGVQRPRRHSRSISCRQLRLTPRPHLRLLPMCLTRAATAEEIRLPSLTLAITEASTNKTHSPPTRPAITATLAALEAEEEAAALDSGLSDSRL